MRRSSGHKGRKIWCSALSRPDVAHRRQAILERLPADQTSTMRNMDAARIPSPATGIPAEPIFAAMADHATTRRKMPKA